MGEDPDYAIRDLYEHIEAGDYPEWKFFIQVMSFAEAEGHRWNPFDVTKVWPHKEFPLIPVGRVVLNRNPSNYFAEVEQIAFAPSRVVPGVEFSPDKMLQGRLFSYGDTQFHRLGPNYQQLPINCPFRTRVHHYQKDGLMALGNNQNGTIIYHPNSFNGPEVGFCVFKKCTGGILKTAPLFAGSRRLRRAVRLPSERRCGPSRRLQRR